MTGKRRWRFSLLPALVFAAGLPVLLGLGAWQLERGAQKRELHTQFETAQAEPPREVTGVPLPAFNALPRYQRVTVRGRYLGERQFLLDNMSREGRPGHHVLTPFQPDGVDYLVIVDRGWRAGLARDARGAIEVDESARHVEGMLAPLPRPALELEGIELPPGWPKVAQFPDTQALAAALNRAVAKPRLLLADHAEEGFARDWQAPGIPPERHYAYAFQWFALAAAWIVLFAMMARRPPAEEGEER